jgi:hypothetical protein
VQNWATWGHAAQLHLRRFALKFTASSSPSSVENCRHVHNTWPTSEPLACARGPRPHSSRMIVPHRHSARPVSRGARHRSPGGRGGASSTCADIPLGHRAVERTGRVGWNQPSVSLPYTTEGNFPQGGWVSSSLSQSREPRETVSTNSVRRSVLNDRSNGRRRTTLVFNREDSSSYGLSRHAPTSPLSATNSVVTPRVCRNVERSSYARPPNRNRIATVRHRPRDVVRCGLD